MEQAVIKARDIKTDSLNDIIGVLQNFECICKFLTSKEHIFAKFNFVDCFI